MTEETQWRKAGYATLTRDGKKLRIRVYSYTYLIPSINQLRALLDGELASVSVITPTKIPVYTQEEEERKK